MDGRATTHGIEVTGVHMPHPVLPTTTELTLNIWDFGGQEVYRISHQFFFSAQAVYLLVWKAREGQEENALNHWMERIRLRVGARARVVIVATHCEERRSELDFPSLKLLFGEMLAGSCEIDSATGHGIDG